MARLCPPRLPRRRGCPPGGAGARPRLPGARSRVVALGRFWLWPVSTRIRSVRDDALGDRGADSRARVRVPRVVSTQRCAGQPSTPCSGSGCAPRLWVGGHMCCLLRADDCCWRSCQQPRRTSSGARTVHAAAPFSRRSTPQAWLTVVPCDARAHAAIARLPRCSLTAEAPTHTRCRRPHAPFAPPLAAAVCRPRNLLRHACSVRLRSRTLSLRVGARVGLRLL